MAVTPLTTCRDYGTRSPGLRLGPTAKPDNSDRLPRVQYRNFRKGDRSRQFLEISCDVRYADIPLPAAVRFPSVEVLCNGIAVSTAGLVIGGSAALFSFSVIRSRRQRLARNQLPDRRFRSARNLLRYG